MELLRHFVRKNTFLTRSQARCLSMEPKRTTYWTGKDLQLDGGRHHFLHIDDFTRTTLLDILKHADVARQKA